MAAIREKAYEEEAVAYGLEGRNRTEPGGVHVPGIPATWDA